MYVAWVVISHLSVCLSDAVSDQHLVCDLVLLFRGFEGGRDDCIAWTPSCPCDLVNAVLCVSHSVWTALKLKLIVTLKPGSDLKKMINVLFFLERHLNALIQLPLCTF